jgi:hypothetical protein
MKAWMVATVLLAPLPAAAQPQPSIAQDLEQAEQAFRRGLDSMKEALERLIEAVPQYEAPQMTEEGDIVIRRRPPVARPRRSEDGIRS